MQCCGPQTAMGYRPLRRFVAVELPLALPGIVAGLRLATVSTVSLISVGALIGRGALGRMFADGYQRQITVELWAAMIATMSLALLFDLVIYLAGRAATPWTRGSKRCGMTRVPRSERCEPSECRCGASTHDTRMAGPSGGGTDEDDPRRPRVADDGRQLDRPQRHRAGRRCSTSGTR